MPTVGVYPSYGGQVLAVGPVRSGCLDAPQIVIQRAPPILIFTCEAKVGEVLYLEPPAAMHGGFGHRCSRRVGV
jgi:hypothetical protein